ncbi:hypothetical protein MNEG_7466 [Monoraphidium neglectum]|jgi:hypothetical protein|uniref:Uncharacterized protein n=1 Tax=Monoraphidium neglectum TaxID=145388 RepID=A0A0D2MB45_9CHLO|nr:hypothetical protein MNEG_7466 [Monoraphidium neglectum]KIZ00495.1 hypothetical protein MNEG_7466 [Monoraphidium neglectum]|eukprot:XP_013899514.1 hypothetical protein MNEG_7466 [Monoraphidium neglectum]
MLGLLLIPSALPAPLKAGGLTAPVRRTLSERTTTMFMPRAINAIPGNTAVTTPVERPSLPAQPSSASHLDDADMSPQGVAVGGAGSTHAAATATGQAGGGTSASARRGSWPRTLGEEPAAAAESNATVSEGRGRTSFSSAPASPSPVTSAVTSAVTALPADIISALAPEQGGLLG